MLLLSALAGSIFYKRLMVKSTVVNVSPTTPTKIATADRDSHIYIRTFGGTFYFGDAAVATNNGFSVSGDHITEIALGKGDTLYAVTAEAPYNTVSILVTDQ